MTLFRVIFFVIKQLVSVPGIIFIASIYSAFYTKKRSRKARILFLKFSELSAQFSDISHI